MRSPWTPVVMADVEKTRVTSLVTDTRLAIANRALVRPTLQRFTLSVQHISPHLRQSESAAGVTTALGEW